MAVRVLMITGQFPPSVGGGGAHASYLTKELRRVKSKNINVSVLTSSIAGLPKYEITKDGIVIHRVDFKHTGTMIHELAIAKGLEICDTLKPDIIHSQHIDGTIIGLHLKAAFDIPFIVTLHKTPLLKFDDSIPKRHPLYSQIKFLGGLDCIDVFVAGSQAFKKEMLKIGMNEEKIRFIYHGVPYQYLRRLAFNNEAINLTLNQINFNKGEFVIICPCRLDERKGLEILLRAVTMLSKEFEDIPFKIVITGEAKNDEQIQLKNRLENIANDAGMQDKLVFKSFSFEQLHSLFKVANVCVLPSRKEGLGLVLLEAMSIKCPVIAANSPGIVEVIDDEKNGLLFEPEDPDDLFRQLKRLISNQKLSKNFENNGLKKVKEVFCSKRMANDYIELYNLIKAKKDQEKS